MHCPLLCIMVHLPWQATAFCRSRNVTSTILSRSSSGSRSQPNNWNVIERVHEVWYNRQRSSPYYSNFDKINTSRIDVESVFNVTCEALRRRWEFNETYEMNESIVFKLFCYWYISATFGGKLYGLQDCPKENMFPWVRNNARITGRPVRHLLLET